MPQILNFNAQVAEFFFSSFKIKIGAQVALDVLPSGFQGFFDLMMFTTLRPPKT
jgi:hypothetical protein